MMPIIGCIADDFTGGTDLANNLVKSGFRTVQVLGVPDEGAPEPEVDAIVVALKSRTIPAGEAVAQSLAALEWLRGIGCEKFYFKYCSTFDSTPRGNIGPVTDALLDALGESLTVMCPAFPDNGRTVYQGHLFVGSVPLNESGMQHHPLTPMTDANLLRVLAAQTPSPVGLLPYREVAGGPEQATAGLARVAATGARMVVADALDNDHLATLAVATRDLRLVTGGSGLALGLGRNYRLDTSGANRLPPPSGARLVLAGSASRATLGQIEHAKPLLPHLKLDPLELDDAYETVIARAMAWAAPLLGSAPLLVYGSGAPEEVRHAQEVLGVQRAGELIERAHSEIAVNLVDLGAHQVIVAGGETSGAVVQALGVRALRIGPEIAPGIPWTSADRGGVTLHLALKSGNFGPPDMFTTAWAALAS
jgi:uncharacterized protein YgbK (DUF1537 family)